MRPVYLLPLLFVVSACGPSMKPDKPKSSAEWLAEQEKLQYEQEQSGTEGAIVEDGELESDQKAKWDERQSEIELKRAARGAATCHGSIPAEKQKDQPKGEAEVTLEFSPSGNVTNASINAPFEGTEVGKCALRAMKAVIVPPFTGANHTVTWKVDLSGAPAEDEKK